MRLDGDLPKRFFATMEKLSNIHKKNLGEEDFDRFPIWVWDDELEGHHPLIGTGKISPEFPTLFVSATFTTQSGCKLKGYLVGRESFYAFGLFAGDEVHVFNQNAPDLAGLAADTISEKLGLERIFPLHYRAAVSLEASPPSEGVFKF